MGAKQNGCCCGPPSEGYRLYAGVHFLVGGVGASGKIIELDPATGALIGTLHNCTRGVRAVEVDPTTGNIYICDTSSSTGDVVALDSSGTLLWTWSPPTPHSLPSLAVSNDGHVYAITQLSPTVYKIDSTTGVENTTGWPYTFGALTTPFAGGGVGHGLCVDQSGNVYVGGVNNLGVRVVKLTSAGSVSWTSLCQNVASAVIINTQANRLAINAAGTQLSVPRYTGSIPSQHNMMFLNAATGAVTGGVTHSAFGYVAAYGPGANSYMTGRSNTGAANGVTVRKDLFNYYSTQALDSYGLAIGPDGAEFLGTGSNLSPSYIIFRMNAGSGWAYTESDSTAECLGLATSAGQVGAFGL